MAKNRKLVLLVLGPLFILAGMYLDRIPRTTHQDEAKPILRENSLPNVTATTTRPLSVLRVIDGDTIAVDRDGVETKVRLIGINAPESVDPRRPVQCFGKEAAGYLRTLLDQRMVQLIYDDSQDRYDKYGRLLAYVYRADGLFVNEAMLRGGFAYEYTYIIPYVFQQEFKTAEREAHNALMGLWSPLTCNGKN